jgi:hypothetical protein
LAKILLQSRTGAIEAIPAVEGDPIVDVVLRSHAAPVEKKAEASPSFFPLDRGIPSTRTPANRPAWLSLNI